MNRTAVDFPNTPLVTGMFRRTALPQASLSNVSLSYQNGTRQHELPAHTVTATMQPHLTCPPRWMTRNHRRVNYFNWTRVTLF